MEDPVGQWHNVTGNAAEKADPSEGILYDNIVLKAEKFFFYPFYVRTTTLSKRSHGSS